MSWESEPSSTSGSSSASVCARCASSAALSQERLGERAGLSGKFIGEVERGEKSISIDSLYHVSVALEVPLRELTDVRADKPRTRCRPRRPRRSSHSSRGRRRPEDVRKAYNVLQAMFGRAS